MLELEYYNVKQLLRCLEWADNEIAVEPCEHSSEEQTDAHCDLRDFILTIRYNLYGEL